MPANTAPIFTLTPQVEWGINMNTANTGNMSAGTAYIVYSAGTNGSYVQKIRFRHQSTNTTNSAATVARVFINNGGASGTTNNNVITNKYISKSILNLSPESLNMFVI